MIRRSQDAPAPPWMVTLNDLTFLLLVFFILFFAMGLSDRSKFERFREAFAGTSRPSPPGGAEGHPDATAGGTRILKSKGRELRIERTGEGTKLTLGGSLAPFAEGDWKLPDGVRESIADVAAWLKGRSNVVVVRGHAAGNAADAVVVEDGRVRPAGPEDPAGDPWLLSAMRANALREALAAAGVEPARLRVRGEGAASPLADPGDERGRERSRRVEVIVTSETAGE